MTSYEIHSFIPGTRANPREMNENFNIVLEQIGTKANNDLSNLSESGQEYIKNCSISKNIGELVCSSIPQTDSSLHLLDGSIIRSNGIYQNFVSYIANLVSTYPDLFVTESDWQQSVTDYGVCGKFVYDSVNNTVRLPKITGIIEGTTDVTALGDLVEAGLPNITGSLGEIACRNRISTGAFNASGIAWNYASNSAGNGMNATFDASRSSSIYGNSSTVQPQTIKAFYYIVIANSTKTEIQVDIDEIATDLNGKADIDLSNVPVSKGILVESYINGTSWYRVYSDGWCEQGGYSTVASSSHISLLKAYSNTNYNVLLIQNTGGGTPVYSSPAKVGITTSSFAVNTYGGGNANVWWEAKGYIR